MKRSFIRSDIGADFHGAMETSDPGEKLIGAALGGIGPSYIFSLFHCELRVIIDVIDVMICSLQSVKLLRRKLHLFLGKSTKTAATRAALFDCNVHQIVYRLGLCPRPHWGSLQRSPDPSCIWGTYFYRKGRGKGV